MARQAGGAQGLLACGRRVIQWLWRRQRRLLDRNSSTRQRSTGCRPLSSTRQLTRMQRVLPRPAPPPPVDDAHAVAVGHHAHNVADQLRRVLLAVAARGHDAAGRAGERWAVVSHSRDHNIARPTLVACPVASWQPHQAAQPVLPDGCNSSRTSTAALPATATSSLLPPAASHRSKSSPPEQRSMTRCTACLSSYAPCRYVMFSWPCRAAASKEEGWGWGGQVVGSYVPARRTDSKRWSATVLRQQQQGAPHPPQALHRTAPLRPLAVPAGNLPWSDPAP